MENKKLTEEEIQTLKELQQKSSNIVAEFGNLEIMKLQVDARKNELVEIYKKHLLVKNSQKNTEMVA
jgi:predicted HAD superfamily hydrolase